MKHKFLSVLLLLFSACGVFATETYMTVELKNGEQYLFNISDKPVVTYVDASLVINSNASTSYSIESVKNYHFTKFDVTMLETVKSSIRVINVDDATMEVQNAQPLTPVSLVSSSGVKVLSSFVGTDGSVVIKLPDIKGVYVLTIGNSSFKVIRK